MELLVADALIVAVMYALARWAMRRPKRFVALVSAGVCATAFVIVFLHYRLEDTRYVAALAASCAAAIVSAVAGGLAAREGVRRSLSYGGVAAAIVVAVAIAYIPVSLTMCWLTDCDLS